MTGQSGPGFVSAGTSTEEPRQGPTGEPRQGPTGEDKTRQMYRRKHQRDDFWEGTVKTSAFGLGYRGTDR